MTDDVSQSEHSARLNISYTLTDEGRSLWGLEDRLFLLKKKGEAMQTAVLKLLSYWLYFEEGLEIDRDVDGQTFRPDVVKVVDLSEGMHIERELMLVKVRATGKDREEMKRISDIFRGRILDVTDKTYTIELTGTGAKLDAFIEALEKGAILETVRTGASGVGRGDRILKVQ